MSQTIRLNLRLILLLIALFLLIKIMHDYLLIILCVLACVIMIFNLMKLKLITLREKITVLKIYHIFYIILSVSLSIISAILLKKRDTVLEIC